MSLVEQAKAAGLSQDEINALEAAEAEQRMNDADLQTIADNGAAATGAEGATTAAPAGEAAAAATGEEGATAAPAAAAGAEGAAAAAALAGEATAAPAAEAAATEKPTAATREMPFAPTLRAEAPADNSERLKQISIEKANGLKRLVDGEIDAAEYAALDERLSGEREVIVSAQSQAALTNAHNEQIYESLFAHEQKRFFREVKNDIDYADADDRRRFDQAFSMIAQDPENAGKDFDQLEDIFSQAHNMVRALKGLKAPAAAAAPAGGAAAATAAPAEAAASTAAPTARKVPATLTGLPVAAPATLDNDPLAKAATLDGEDLERFVAGMSKGDHDKLMRRASQ